ncbi:MAG: NAD(+) diphosphatase [Ilumatobacteraceae bacterium]
MTEFVPHHVPPADLDPRRGRYLHVIGTAVWEIDEPLDAVDGALSRPSRLGRAVGRGRPARRGPGRRRRARSAPSLRAGRRHRLGDRRASGPDRGVGPDPSLLRTMRDPDRTLRQRPVDDLSVVRTARYPRLAPAIITLITRHDGEEALLARGAQFPVPMYSCLAGFVEPGESLEQAVHREVREEVGIEISDVTYAGSQPWPFPHSLMLGFTAEHASGELVCDPVEILDAQWYRRDQLPMIPPGISIARKLIDAWVSR